ncbi:MAG: hypothetical protein ABJB95_10755, partial [Gemmatimonadales bacterium]
MSPQAGKGRVGGAAGSGAANTCQKLGASMSVIEGLSEGPTGVLFLSSQLLTRKAGTRNTVAVRTRYVAFKGSPLAAGTAPH